MKQEEKELLLKDLCARLPYGVKITDGLHITTLKVRIDTAPATLAQFIHSENLRYYLRPLSSMMQGEWEEMTALIYPYGRVNLNNKNELLLWLSAEGNDMPIMLMDNVFSWLDKNMFDYRSLIPLGLAIEAPEDMYK